MKKTTLLLSIASLLLIGTGCEKKKEEKPKETFKSYKFYREHLKETIATVKKCRKINYKMSYAVKKDCGYAEDALHVYKELHLIERMDWE